MQKVYLLLRNNRQTGPHTLEELLQQDLKPMDLVWVEGRSAGWSYPSEIEALKPFVKAPVPEQRPVSVPKEEPQAATPFSKPLNNRHIFVSMPAGAVPRAQAKSPQPADDLEQKAEALRRRAQAYAATPPGEEPLTTNYTRPLVEVEEDYTAWVYQKLSKKKRKFDTKKILLLSCLGAALMAGAWWVSSSPKPAPETTPEAQLPQQQPTASSHEEIIPMVNQSDTKISKLTPSPVYRRPYPVKKSQRKTVVAAVQSVPTAAPVVPERQGGPAKEGPMPERTTTGKKSPGTTVKEERQAFGQKLKGLFKKLTKKEEPPPATEPPQPAQTSGSQRRATQREEEEGTAPATINLAEGVDLKTPYQPDNWMMGVKGAKLTLSNHNRETVRTATAEVRYYNEDNTLLDKKTIAFSNIAPGRSQTLAVPDHRLADHFEYKLLSASGAAEAVAKQ